MNLSNSVCSSTPAIAMDNTIYFVASGILFAVTPSGSNKWQTVIDTSSFKDTSAVIGSDGTVYANGYETRTLHAVNPDGTHKWAIQLSDNLSEAAAIGQNGRLYLTVFAMGAVSATGASLWQNPFPVNTPPVIGPDNTIYAGTVNLGVAAFTPEGQKKWDVLPYPFPAFPTTPAVGASGRIYHCVSNALYAVTPQGTVEWAYASSDPTSGNYQTFSAPTIGPDGTIYAAFGTTLYAIASGGDKPANSTWPMYQQNSRHTGRIERPALDRPKKRADANFQFQIYDQLGNTNAIQTSPDLAIWSLLTNVVITNVPLDFVDLEASNFTRRFYRAVQQ